MSHASKRFRNKIVVILLSLLFFFGFFNLITNVSAANDSTLRIEEVVWDGNIVEGELTEFTVKIKNEGPENFSGIVEIALYVENQFRESNSSSFDIDAGEIISIHLEWTPTFGDDELHRLVFVINDDFNNIWDTYELINERDTKIEINSITLPDVLYTDERFLVNASVTNYGTSTDEKISARLNSSVDGEIEIIEKTGLNRDETHYFMFNWTPTKIGKQKLTLYIFLNDEIEDSMEKNVKVNIARYDWWDEKWHYRSVLSLRGTGNYSKSFNFTNILKNLNVKKPVFENETLRIVRYSQQGKVIGIVEKYSFNESDGFNKTKNATGILKWIINSSSNINYYAVYFDVEANIGNRSKLNETYIGNASQDISIYLDERHESWWVELESPKKSTFILANENINISVISKAKITNVSATISRTGVLSEIYNIALEHLGNFTNWYNNNFSLSEEGNWTFTFNCLDNSSVFYNFSETFYVGKPDLSINNMTVSRANEEPYSDFYKDDILNITVWVETLFSSVEGVNISLDIIDTEDEKNLFSDYILRDFDVDSKTKLVFKWKANISGEFNIQVLVDSDNTVSEINENNNIIEKEISVYEWPDLYVEDIVLPNFNLTELDKVKIVAEVGNNVNFPANNYKIGLFIEKKYRENPSIKYENLVYNTTFSINGDSTKEVSLYWESAEVGTWSVGVKIFWNESKKDFNPLNNMFLSPDFISVKSVEVSKPTIENVVVTPPQPIQGDLITIYADVYDDNGLSSVKINFTSPDNSKYSGSMVRSLGNRFKYSFDKTSEIGEYIFIINAIDGSSNKNFRIYNGVFKVFEDNIKPEIIYVSANPKVQLVNKSVNILVLPNDNIGISEAEVTIYGPDGFYLVDDMNRENDKYVYENVYKNVGLYRYYIQVKDDAGNQVVSKENNFWITKDLKDSDSDGIPDVWEEKYNLDPFNASDANIDYDNDGYTNLEEYKMNTNPRKNILLQNVVSKIGQNIWYLFLSIVALFTIIIFSFFVKRRVAS